MSHFVREASWASAAVLLIVVVVAALVLPPYYLTLVISIGLTSISASGLTLLLSSNQVSLGHAAYVGIGAYTAAFLSRDLGVPSVLASVVGVLSSALAALVIGLATLRLKGHFLALATLAVGIAVPTLIVAASGITGGASGFGQIPPLGLGSVQIEDARVYAVLVWLLTIAIIAGFSRATRSRIGRGIAALRSGDELAVVFGIDPPRLKLLVFVVAGATAGLSGVLYTFFYRYLSPAAFGLPSSINLLIVCVIGGSGNAFGAVIGATVVALIEMALQNVLARGLGLPGNLEALVFGVIMIVILIRWPGGLWSLFETVWPRNIPLRACREGTKQTADNFSGIGPMVRVANVTKSFGGLKALSDVSFDINRREIVGLIGPNGAGKSTMFNIITGLVHYTSGTVSLAGKQFPKPLRLIDEGVARTFQHVKLVPSLTVIENVAIGCYSKGHAGLFSGMFALDKYEELETFERALRALQAVGLSSLALVPASVLAMGQARMVEIARAIVSQPNLLLLDEPAAGLRTGEKLKLVTMLHRLRRQGTSILIVEHDMDLVMNCVDRIVVLDRGQKLAAGQPDEVRGDPLVIAAYLGT